MLKFFHKMRGQSTLEYAVLIVIVVGALLSIQMYIKRGVQGRLKSSSDDIGDQFSPGNTNVIKSTRVKSKTRELFGRDESGTAKQGESSSTITNGAETTNTVERSQIDKVDQEYWGR